MSDNHPLAHTPVLLKEVLQAFTPKGTDRLLDGTLGLGGHTKAYLEAGGEAVTAVGVEPDPKALATAKDNLQQFGSRVTYIQGSFHHIKDSVQGGGILYPPMFTHILLDLGIGSHQLSDQERGFSFSGGASLQMRYGDGYMLPDARVPALNSLTKKLNRYPDVADMLQHLDARSLAQIIHTYGEEKYAMRIASALKSLTVMPTRAAELADIIKEAVPKNYERGRIHPATRTFQALRLATNRELEVLETGLPALVDVLADGGTIAVIAFHSLEDRIVKQFFQAEAKGCICPPEIGTCICGKTPRLKIITKRPIIASTEETSSNPRARSAKMRVAQKIQGSG